MVDALGQAPAPHTMTRDGWATKTVKPGLCTQVFCPCLGPTTAPTPSSLRKERVFYNSALAKRSLLGRWHYCVACPGWSKLTTERVTYSRWDLVPCTSVPGQCFGVCCDCGNADPDWLPPDPKTLRTPQPHDECSVPCGRTLDTFDSDIIVDASAHQTCCQILRGEGDLVLYRKAGADISDPSEIFVLPDVVAPFDVFNEVTFELSKINLQGATSSVLGARMGATVWGFDARSGAEGTPQGTSLRGSPRGWRGEVEHVYYDSLSARRTCCGYVANAECCFPPIYKVTSERVVYTECVQPSSRK